MFSINPADPTPLHAQIERGIRVAIATGRLGLGDQLPTVRQLAVDLRVNANTVARVYGELERAGIVETRRGVGTFVRESIVGVDPPADRVRRLAGLADRFLTEAASFGFTAREVIHQLKLRLEEKGKSDA
ncbi:MAG: GntR family transcriptional regulator [Isosphaeraceae bacterium]